MTRRPTNPGSLENSADRPSEAVRRRRWSRRIALAGAGLLVGLAGGELVSLVYAWLRFGTASVSELHSLEHGNAMLGQSPNSYQATLVPHPFLAYVHDRDFGEAAVGNIGLFGGRDMPLERDPESFTILVLGGSLAAQFAQPTADGERPLEELLSERFDFGGRRVVVLNGASGGWKQPQQLIMLSLYGDVVDAVVTLEGFNEFHSLTARRLEYPPDFERVSPRAADPSHEFARSVLARSLFDASRRSRWIDASRLAYFVTRAFRRGVVDLFESPEAPAELSVKSIFAFPADWDPIRRARYNLASYEKYLRLVDRTADALGLQLAIFFQPVPATGKTLTPEEHAAAASLGTDYGPAYRRMVQRLMRLSAAGLPVFDLLDVFADAGDTIYADAAHCRFDLPNHGSTGYRIMAEGIAGVLEREWHLRRR